MFLLFWKEVILLLSIRMITVCGRDALTTILCEINGRIHKYEGTHLLQRFLSRVPDSPGLTMSYDGLCPEIENSQIVKTKPETKVCGDDGRTYNSAIELLHAKLKQSHLKIPHHGPCLNTATSETVEEIVTSINNDIKFDDKVFCGNDLKTYKVKEFSWSEQQNVKILHPGPCVLQLADDHFNVFRDPNDCSDCYGDVVREGQGLSVFTQIPKIFKPGFKYLPSIFDTMRDWFERLRLQV